MFDNYEDYLYSSSKADELIEEMKDKLHELITDEAKEIMVAYRKAENELSDLNRQITRKKRDIKNLQEELKELEEKQIKADKYDMPRKYIDAFVRDVTGYFAPGDKVFVLQRKSKRVDCNKCNGEKKIKAIIEDEENTIECPKCKGYGSVSENYDIIEEREISDVYLKLCFGESRVRIWTSDSVYMRGAEYATKPENIFKTYKDAEKALKELSNEHNK